MSANDYGFDVEKTAKECIEWIQSWFKANGNAETKAIIGVSGGKDSTVCTQLLVNALGKERVIAVLMPNGTQADIQDSYDICAHIGLVPKVVNIQAAYEGITKAICGDEELSAQYKTNTPARLRMVTLYGIAGQVGNCRVCNTCNLSEDKLGYSTHYGDSAGDFSPLNKLTTEEVVAIGDYLGIPQKFTHKAPSDGMCGKTDEDNLGFTYHETNQLIRYNEKGPHYEQICNKYKWNKFKVEIIQLPHFDPNLPDYL